MTELAEFFGNLKALFFLFLLPAFGILFLYGNRQRTKALHVFASPHLLKILLESVDLTKRRKKQQLILLAVLLLVVALLRPKWGYTWVDIYQEGIDIMVVLDVSKSMLADDISPSRSENRLERAKREIKDLVQVVSRKGGDRIGLTIFAGRAFVQCPLTFDFGAFNLFLDQISTNSIQLGGTGILNALETANRAFQSKLKQYKAIILITDGEENQIPVEEKDPQKAQEIIHGHLKKMAQYLRHEGVYVYTIGIGTRQGSLIPLTVEKNGREEKTYLKDRQGEYVKTTLDRSALELLALETQGVFYGSGGGSLLLETLYEKHISKLKKKTLSGSREKRGEERFQIPLFFAFLLLFIEPLMSERRQIHALASAQERQWKIWKFFVISFLFISALALFFYGILTFTK
jgi:Ca-activated chloride channel family protein